MTLILNAKQVRRQHDGTCAPGLAEECRRQSEVIAAGDQTDAGRAEMEFWERVTADAWDGLD